MWPLLLLGTTEVCGRAATTHGAHTHTHTQAQHTTHTALSIHCTQHTQHAAHTAHRAHSTRCTQHTALMAAASPLDAAQLQRLRPFLQTNRVACRPFAPLRPSQQPICPARRPLAALPPPTRRPPSHALAAAARRTSAGGRWLAGPGAESPAWVVQRSETAERVKLLLWARGGSEGARLVRGKELWRTAKNNKVRFCERHFSL